MHLDRPIGSLSLAGLRIAAEIAGAWVCVVVTSQSPDCLAALARPVIGQKNGNEVFRTVVYGHGGSLWQACHRSLHGGTLRQDAQHKSATERGCGRDAVIGELKMFAKRLLANKPNPGAA